MPVTRPPRAADAKTMPVPEFPQSRNFGFPEFPAGALPVPEFVSRNFMLQS